MEHSAVQDLPWTEYQERLDLEPINYNLDNTQLDGNIQISYGDEFYDTGFAPEWYDLSSENTRMDLDWTIITESGHKIKTGFEHTITDIQVLDIDEPWSGSSGFGANYDFYNDNQEHIRFALRIQLGLGWVMCIIAGLGFSILPLIYDLHSFGKSVMRTYVGLNISGQFAIMLGVVSGIMMDDLLIFQTLATIGITLLCASLVTLGPSAIAIFKIRTPKENKSGPFTYSVGALMPFLGAITLACWILRERVERILDLSESIIFDFFIPLTVVALIISHQY